MSLTKPTSQRTLLIGSFVPKADLRGFAISLGMRKHVFTSLVFHVPTEP